MRLHGCFIVILLLIWYFIWSMSTQISEEFSTSAVNDPSGGVGMPPDSEGESSPTSDIKYADNIVDKLPTVWHPLPPVMEEAKECGVIQIRPTRDKSPGGFFPNTKNCNLGERVILKNYHPGVNQMVSCRVTPMRSFVCTTDQLKQGCALPPFYNSGTYSCYSAMPSNSGTDAFKNKIIVNNNTTNVYDDRGALMSAS